MPLPVVSSTIRAPSDARVTSTTGGERALASDERFLVRNGPRGRHVFPMVVAKAGLWWVQGSVSLLGFTALQEPWIATEPDRQDVTSHMRKLIIG